MSTPHAVRYLDEAQVLSLLDPDRLIEGVRDALIELSAGRARQPLRMVMDFDGGAPGADPGMLFVKPAQVGRALATKVLTWVPANASRGLPTLASLVLLFDPSTGQPLAILEGNALTAMRTAAATAVAAQALARTDAGVVTMLGSGVLARSHARLLRRVRPIHEIRIWSRDPENVERCADDVGGVGYTSAEAAVSGADIVCTLSNASEPILRGAWLGPGTFVAAVGAPRPTWRELDDDAMRHPVIADQREAALQESGDVRGSGADIYAEIGEILGGRVAAPPQGSSVIFKSLGLAIEDAVAARLVYDALQ